MLTIRLQRVGKKKTASYRLVISEKARDTKDVYLENLGTFDPHAKANAFLPKTERITYWISKGAQTSGTVHNLLVNAGIIKSDKKKKSVFLSKKRKTKLGEKSKAKAADLAAKAAKEAAAAAAPAPAEAAAPEAPAAV